jgi:hypothetical protein
MKHRLYQEKHRVANTANRIDETGMSRSADRVDEVRKRTANPLTVLTEWNERSNERRIRELR